MLPGGPLKICALSSSFISKFKGVCGGNPQGVPPIHAVVAELTKPGTCLGDALRGITKSNVGTIILQARGSPGGGEVEVRKGLREGEIRIRLPQIL